MRKKGSWDTLNLPFGNQHVTRWWFQICIYIYILFFSVYCLSFTLIWGRFPFWLAHIFQMGGVKNHQLGHQRNPRFKLWGCQHKSGGQRMRRGHPLMLQKSGKKLTSWGKGSLSPFFTRFYRSKRWLAFRFLKNFHNSGTQARPWRSCNFFRTFTVARDHAKGERGPQETIPKTRSYIDDYNYHTMQNGRGPTNFAEPQILIAPLYTGSFWHRILQ